MNKAGAIVAVVSKGERGKPELLRWRYALVLLAFACLPAALLVRAVDLQLVNNEFLQHQGDSRHLRTMAIPAHRGMVKDRYGEPLAISTPVDSIWAHPGNLLSSGADLAALAELLGMEVSTLRNRLEQRAGREFVYLRRHVNPDLASQVLSLGLPGVASQREFRRYYPAGEVAGHLLGFTDIDDVGLEGLELSYESWLRGRPGAKRVLRDRLGRVISDVEQLREPAPGRDLSLSIDRRLQYVAYRELKRAVQAHGARGGSLVLLDSETGEVLAMVNQPTFNPNARHLAGTSERRNRAVTDSFEPGSTIKPFTVAAALESGRFEVDSPLNTHPGTMRVGNHTVRDIRDYGRIDLATLISKSSNVGAAQLALDLPEDAVWGLLGRVGLGRVTGAGFPGETAGSLSVEPPRSSIDRATLSFGYGVASTPLQLTAAYAALAADGVLRSPSFLRVDEPPAGEQVISARTAAAVRRMLEQAVADDGTGRLASVSGYRVAGKTGTSRKSIAGGYADDRYVAWFAGMAPASRPRLVMTVMIDEPAGELHYGGQVAAPVFSEVMSAALRLLNVSPDADEPAPPMAAMRGAGQ
ncbi:cell division protein FtsI (penicillin-binding protein 3) [Natronocella acetinitrilica]|uniref:Peptidoglycan D,D-transpeptidase FtsI n=1 Tax=Natronocella acetinitrilica TaxID=414046 RepID=A0AAE3G1E3_9GAMM|nr:cell division protein FtsI (penicillin-binding protein 3) [Natronocella acetinitrilica]